MLIALQRWIRSQPILYRLTLGMRILLAVGFIPTGMVKLLGYRFTRMSPETPIGGFFETMYQSGPYWHFLGLMQIAAGVLVLWPSTATVGAILLFGIVCNIFVITVSYDFNFTPVITGLMVLATVYLLLWDYHRLRPMIGREATSTGAVLEMPRQRLRGAFERGVYIVGFASGLAFFGGLRGLVVPWPWNRWFLACAALSMLVAIVYGFTKARQSVPSSRSVATPVRH